MEGFGARVQAARRKIRKPLLYVLVLAAFAAIYIDLPIVQNVAMTAAALIAIELLFEVHGTTSGRSKRRTFPAFHDVARDFRKHVEGRAGSKGHVRVRWLGLSMEYGASLLEDLLEGIAHRHPHAEVEVDVLMLDPSWPQLGALNETWPQKARAASSTLAKAAKVIAGATGGRQRLQLRTYRHVPYWHGFVIDDDRAYIGRCVWRQDGLTGGENPYELIVLEPSDARVQEFLAWFQFSERTETSAGAIW
ncbi:MAG: hypothetical protein KBD01_17930 [Acidobacteria bacterium]|nr:hypothetical protein [Acidobacteriota bacterium]